MLKGKTKSEKKLFRTDKKDKLYAFLLIFFLIISLLYISPGTIKARSLFHSFQLKKVTKTDGNNERTDYIDSAGRITIAADQGYATMIISQTEKGKIERYYDAKGNPISRYNGYYAVLREYDKNGNNIRSTYLDSEDNPIESFSGYATEECVYNENRQVVLTKYYDKNINPVRTAQYGYGRINEYDENGNNTRTTYIDYNGEPIMTRQGYASVVRRFYSTDGPEKGKAEYEFYYDENGMPTSLSLGQYAIHKEYNENGQTSVLTYLDANGDPIETNKGYTTIIRSFHSDNSIATERYFDLNGNPFPLSEGQYGIKKEYGRTVYLNEKGEERFNIKTYLYNHSWIVVVLSSFAVIISGVANRKWNLLLLAANFAVILYFTLLFRGTGEIQAIRFLEYYRRFFTDRVARADILKNIWLFIPLGAVLFQLYPRKSIILIPVVMSIIIETIQFITTTGYCEIDDIISNGIGGMIGFYTAKLISIRQPFDRSATRNDTITKRS